MAGFPVKVLIMSVPADTHAVAVACALKQLGHQPFLYCAPSAVGEADTSLWISNNKSAWSFGTVTQDAAAFDVIWQRRRSLPSLTMECHPEDRDFIVRENAAFFSYFWALASESTYWLHDTPVLINGEPDSPYHASKVASR